MYNPQRLRLVVAFSCEHGQESILSLFSCSTRMRRLQQSIVADVIARLEG